MPAQLLTLGTAPVLRPGRRRSVLQELAHEDAIVSFQGLRRRLGLHPETLRRTLRRLAQEGMAEAEEAGYRATEAGRQAVAGQDAPTRPAETVLQAVLPPGCDADTVAAALAGRWLGDLRWYGRSDGPGETTLIWLSPDGGFVRLRLRGGTLGIEAEAGASWAPLLPPLAELL